MGNKKTTIKDISKIANCTAATVSMVMNNRPGISKKTCERVRRIAADLDYQPNMVARNLVSNKSKSIGLIINNFSDHFFAYLAEGVEKEARKRGYTIFICSIDSDLSLEEMYADMLVAKGVDGMVLSTVCSDSTYFEKLDRIGLPYVFVNRKSYHPDFAGKVNYVVLDNFEAGYKAVQHLYRLGHDRIGIITGTLRSSANIERTEGAKKAMVDNGLKVQSGTVINCDNCYNKAYEFAEKLIRMKESVTAVFAEDDTMALAAREAILRNGLQIPEDMALIGFDDTRMSSLAGIELTTIREKEKGMGQMGVNLLIDKIENKFPDAINQVTLKSKLIIRKSCGYSKTGYVR